MSKNYLPNKGILLAGAILILFLTQCKEAEKQSGKEDFLLKGKVKEVKNDEFVFLKLQGDSGLQIIDSVMPDESGEFSFIGVPDTERLYVLNFYNRQNVPVFLQKGVVEVTAEGVASGKYEVKGSPNSDILKLINQTKDEFEANTKKIEALYYKLIGAKKKEEALGLAQKFDSLNKSYKTKLKQIMLESGPSPATYLATTILNIDEDFPFLDSLEAVFKAKAPHARYTKQLTELLDKPRKLAIGKTVPDLTLTTPQGTSLSISQFKGKVLVLDFWASWCGPCRQENPNMVKLYEANKGKGLEIIGISFDHSKEKWEEAIQKDKLSWRHMSDLKAWQSEAADIFMVNGIPHTVVVDKEGKIAAKGLRGPALEAKIKELLRS